MTQLSIFAAARTAPTQIALVTETACYTYAQLAALARGRAAALMRLHGPVLLQLRSNLDSLLWLYAAAASGSPFVPLPPRATLRERIAAQALTGGREPPTVAGDDSESFREKRVDPEQAFALVPTSGTSGNPKIVVLSRRAVLASAAACEANLGTLADDRWLLCLPLSHVGGLAVVVRMLAARRTVVLFDSGEAGLLASSRELAARIKERRVSIVSLVPTVLDKLLREGFTPPASLRAVLLGGAGCAPELAERAWHARIPLLTSYGLTESGSQIVARRYAERYEHLAQRDDRVSSGRPLAGVEIKIVGDRIAVKGPVMLTRYLGVDLPAVDSGGWFLTQDRGVFGERGELFVLGRTDLVLVTGGENVDPEEVERALRELPEVQDACVFGLPSAEFGLRIAAVVVLQKISWARAPALRIAALREGLARTLAPSKIPRSFVFAAALPVTATGKLDRAACVRQFGALAGEDAGARRLSVR